MCTELCPRVFGQVLARLLFWWYRPLPQLLCRLYKELPSVVHFAWHCAREWCRAHSFDGECREVGRSECASRAYWVSQREHGNVAHLVASWIISLSRIRNQGMACQGLRRARVGAVRERVARGTHLAHASLESKLTMKRAGTMVQLQARVGQKRVISGHISN